MKVYSAYRMRPPVRKGSCNDGTKKLSLTGYRDFSTAIRDMMAFGQRIQPSLPSDFEFVDGSVPGNDPVDVERDFDDTFDAIDAHRNLSARFNSAKEDFIKRKAVKMNKESKEEPKEPSEVPPVEP